MIILRTLSQGQDYFNKEARMFKSFPRYNRHDGKQNNYEKTCYFGHIGHGIKEEHFNSLIELEKINIKIISKRDII